MRLTASSPPAEPSPAEQGETKAARRARLLVSCASTVTSCPMRHSRRSRRMRTQAAAAGTICEPGDRGSRSRTHLSGLPRSLPLAKRGTTAPEPTPSSHRPWQHHLGTNIKLAGAVPRGGLTTEPAESNRPPTVAHLARGAQIRRAGHCCGGRPGTAGRRGECVARIGAGRQVGGSLRGHHHAPTSLG